MPQRKTPADYEHLAQVRGFVWLGPAVANVRTKTTWQCPAGHQWQATYNKIQQKRGCPHCAGRAPKKPADYQRLAKRRGFQWSGPEVPDTHTPTGWACPDGHRWQNSFSHIQRGQGCPTCAQIAQRRPPEDYDALAQERGFTWLGPAVTATDMPTGWQCSQGHVWQTAYHVIQFGAGCPTCANIAKRNPPEMYTELARKRGFI